MSVCICIKKKEEGGLVVVNSISVYSNITFFLLLLSKSVLNNSYTLLLQGMRIPTYDNQLLNLAEDLGRRLLPAFDTPSGAMYLLDYPLLCTKVYARSFWVNSHYLAFIITANVYDFGYLMTIYW